MKSFLLIMVGAIGGTVLLACAMGKNSVKYEEFPVLAPEYSVYGECSDNQEGTEVCRSICLEWKNKNECKKEDVDRKKTNVLLKAKWVMVTYEQYLKSLKVK